jgi:hypothetical protein
MEDRATWMYGLPRYSQAYVDEVDKFIIAAVNHAKTLSGTNCSVICPCKDYKNHMATYAEEIIRSHLIRQGFVPDYTVWIHHGEVMVVDDNDDDQEDDPEAQHLSQFSDTFEAQMQHESANEQAYGYDAGGVDNNDGDVGGVDNNDGGAREGDAKNFDNLEEILRAIGPEILQQKKGLENLERVKTASKETVYGVEKGCPTHWTLLRFVLELLILKAKYRWSDCSFDDLLHLLSSMRRRL